MLKTGDEESEKRQVFAHLLSGHVVQRKNKKQPFWAVHCLEAIVRLPLLPFLMIVNFYKKNQDLLTYMLTCREQYQHC